MTVKELIDQLKEYPDDYTVTFEKDNCTDDIDGYEYLCVNEIYKSSYSKEVIIEVW